MLRMKDHGTKWITFPTISDGDRLNWFAFPSLSALRATTASSSLLDLETTASFPAAYDAVVSARDAFTTEKSEREVDETLTRLYVTGYR